MKLFLYLILSGAKAVTLRPAVQEASGGGEHVYYLGVGSNLLKSKLVNRGLNGTKIDVLSFEPAIVYDHRLAFNMKGFPFIESAMGGIEPCVNQQCHGSLAKLTLAEYEKVWASEGGLRPNPGYMELVIDAYPYNSTVPVKAIVLRTAPHRRLSKDAAPSERYLNIIKQGAKELGLHEEYQLKLSQIIPEKVSPIIRTVFNYNSILSAILTKHTPINRYAFFIADLLWPIYTPPTSHVIHRFISQFLSMIIMTPGMCLGFVCKLAYTVRGKKPPSIFGAPPPPKLKVA